MADRNWPSLAPAASWRDVPEEERDEALQRACRAAMQLLEGAPDRLSRLARTDPLPASTVALVRRLARRPHD